MADPATAVSLATASITVGQVSAAIIAIGALGTASFGLVDGTKSLFGGMSNVGFAFIKKLVMGILSPSSSTPTPLVQSILDSLKGNWINGVPKGDQELKAKSLILLALTPEAASKFATSLGIDGTAIATLLPKMLASVQMTSDEKDLWGRFDLIVTSRLDQTYQRADQRYRNCCKLLAMVIAVALACGGYYFAIPPEWKSPAGLWRCILAGVFAGPLAPIAKDLASSLSAGTKAAQALAE